MCSAFASHWTSLSRHKLYNRLIQRVPNMHLNSENFSEFPIVELLPYFVKITKDTEVGAA